MIRIAIDPQALRRKVAWRVLPLVFLLTLSLTLIEQTSGLPSSPWPEI